MLCSVFSKKEIKKNTRKLAPYFINIKNSFKNFASIKKKKIATFVLHDLNYRFLFVQSTVNSGRQSTGPGDRWSIRAAGQHTRFSTESP